MRRGVERSVTVACAWLAATLMTQLAAQNADAPRAPRILDAPATPVPTTARPAPEPSRTASRPPNAARLAPLPEERRFDDDVEEIIVRGQGWRLPDLGSEWRARQKEAANAGRFTATALPLYDPSEPPLHSEAFTATTSSEERRHGYIELFKLRFGRRSSD